MYVRPIVPEDREPLVSLLQRIELFRPEEVTVAVELIDDALDRSAESGYTALVAVDVEGGKERPLGYGCFGATPMTQHSYDLYWVAVDPDHRGRHIGRLLMQATEEKIRLNGGRLIRVETSSQDGTDGTLAFYWSNDFKQAGRIPDFYRPGDDLLILFKEVGSP